MKHFSKSHRMAMEYIPCHYHHQLSTCFSFISCWFLLDFQVNNFNLKAEHDPCTPTNSIIWSHKSLYVLCFFSRFSVHRALVCVFQFQWVALVLTGRLFLSLPSIRSMRETTAQTNERIMKIKICENKRNRMKSTQVNRKMCVARVYAEDEIVVNARKNDAAN